MQGVSIKSIYHFAQNAKDGLFREFDYGSNELNKKHYHKYNIPTIDLGSIGLSGIPIAMFQRSKDILLTPQDARWTRDQIMSQPLGRRALVHYEELEGGGHESYFVGNDMSYLNKVIDLLEEYNPRPLTEREKQLHWIAGEEDDYEKQLDKVYEKYIDSPQ